MATIKDVAKLAGVSHGTVSNVLSGYPGVSIDKVKRVQEAVKTLKYQPDIKARNLKSSTSNQIAVILPNISDRHYANIFTAVERILSENGYTPSLFISSEIPAREKEILQTVISLKWRGIIMATCQPENSSFFSEITERMPFVFIDRLVEGFSFNYVGADHYKAFYPVINKEIRAGKKVGIITGPAGYESERQVINAFKDNCNELKITSCNEYIRETNLDKQSGFRAAVQLLNFDKDIETLITTSGQIVEGIQYAKKLLKRNSKQKLTVYTLSENKWNAFDNESDDLKYIPVKSFEFGEQAAELILKNIENQTFFEPRRLILDDGGLSLDKTAKSPDHRQGALKKTLRILLQKSTASSAVKALLPDFNSLTGIQVEITEKPYSKMYESIVSPDASEKYDVIQSDIPWLSELANNNIILPLDSFIDKDSSIISQHINKIIDEYSKYQGSYYGLPFVFGTQLLFYRKDLFESVDVRHHFYDWYKTELRPPKSWNEFNAVARFFTKKENPESPVDYGTTLGSRLTSGAMCEYLPRLWAYNGDIFNPEGNLVLNNWEAVQALENYRESFKYAQPGAADHLWNEQVDVYKNGQAAMMVMFVAHATDITDRKISKVVGKTGYDIVPGGKPLLGGWSLSIKKDSVNPEASFQFIKWITSSRLAVPYTIMGGATPSLSLFKSSELLTMYPWLPKSLESFAHCKRRLLPENILKAGISSTFIQDTVGRAVYSSVTGNQSASELIKAAETAIKIRLS